MARAGVEPVLLPAWPSEVTALTSWVSVWAEPVLRVHHGVTQSQRVQGSTGEMHMTDAPCSPAASAGFPTFCSSLSTALLLLSLGADKGSAWYAGDDTSLGHLLHEAACSPSRSDLWTLENCRQSSAHPSCSLTPSPLGPPSLASHRAIPRATGA